MVSVGLTPDALAGVKGFIYVLQNLSEDFQEMKAAPTKRLTSYEQPSITPKPGT